LGRHGASDDEPEQNSFAILGPETRNELTGSGFAPDFLYHFWNKE
jgi:hypothetical protein